MEKERDFKSFLECLKKACSNMNHHYIQLPTAGSEEPIFRERVYCYELYHQLRNILGDNYLYNLHGEVDKCAHKIIKNDCIPDLIVHKAGGMERNLAVVEVKPVNVKNRLARLGQDIEKLKYFLDLREGPYYRGIMLIYGNGERSFPKNLKDKARYFIGDYDDCICLLWHKGPGEIPKEV